MTVIGIREKENWLEGKYLIPCNYYDSGFIDISQYKISKMSILGIKKAATVDGDHRDYLSYWTVTDLARFRGLSTSNPFPRLV